MVCPRCGLSYADHLTACPSCGGSASGAGPAATVAVREKGWWERNWKWAVPAFVLVTIGVFVWALVGFVMGAFRSSYVYQEALARARARCSGVRAARFCRGFGGSRFLTIPYSINPSEVRRATSPTPPAWTTPKHKQSGWPRALPGLP